MVSMQATNSEYRELLREIESGPYGALLADLQARHKPLQAFAAWGEILDAARRSPVQSTEADGVLRALLQEYWTTRDERIGTVLTAIAWRLLSGLHASRAGLDRDTEELWHNILLFFFEALQPSEEIPRSRILRWLLRGTENRLRNHYHRERARESLVAAVDDETLCAASGSYEMPVPDEEEVDLLDWVSEQAKKGRITWADHKLILQTRIEGREIRECARTLGVSRSCLYQRRKRAEEILKRSVKTTRILCGLL